MEKLNALIKKHGGSANAFADRTGIPQTTISRWMNGGKPGWDHIKSICEYCNVTPNWLMGWDDEPAKTDQPNKTEISDKWIRTDMAIGITSGIIQSTANYQRPMSEAISLISKGIKLAAHQEYLERIGKLVEAPYIKETANTREKSKSA